MHDINTRNDTESEQVTLISWLCLYTWMRNKLKRIFFLFWKRGKY